MANGSTPFSNIPEQTAGGGVLDFLFGKSTTRFAAEQEELASRSRATAIQGLARRVQEGVPVAKAITEFMSSPEGVAFFEAAGSPAEILDLAQGLRGPAKESVVTGPGDVRSTFDPTTGTTTEALRVPTTETQTFQALAEAAQLDPETLAEVARFTLLSGGQPTSTENERAIGRMVQSGAISKELGDKVLSGVLRVTPLLNEFGQPVGTVVTDLSTGQSRTAQVGGALPTAEGAPTPTPAQAQAPTPTPAPAAEPTLFDLATTEGGISGIVPGVAETFQGLTGQAGVDVASAELLQARQIFRTEKQNLLRALVINPKFPVGEVERISDEINIEPGVGTDMKSLVSRMQAVDRSLRTRVDAAQRDALDESLPVETRRQQAANASAIQNYLARLGIPEGLDVETLEFPTAKEQFGEIIKRVEESFGEGRLQSIRDRFLSKPVLTPEEAAAFEQEVLRLTPQEREQLIKELEGGSQ